MDHWTGLAIVRQASGELGLVPPSSLVASSDDQASQLLALLNSAGNELLLYYPWEQFCQVWEFQTEAGKDKYDLPPGWSYFINQTQFDKTNGGPLQGPKSPQEWAWVTGRASGLSSLRYRVLGGQLVLHPAPGSTPTTIRMEYVSEYWVSHADSTAGSMVIRDSDTILYHPWMTIKFLKMKFHETKGFDTVASNADFMRVFLALTGKDKGAPVLSLSPAGDMLYIGPWSVPDGNWNAT